MRRNIFDEDAKQALVDRVRSLSPTATPLWGVMNVTEMLHHCNTSLRMIMHAEPATNSSTIKQVILRVAFLTVLTKFPKEVRAPRKLDVKRNGAMIGDFDKHKNELLSLLDMFSMQQNIYGLHPYFGKLSHKQWGIFTWMHIDHHLRQFGK
jgi:hypothetical protein